jgi:hypothetical protein
MNTTPFPSLSAAVRDHMLTSVLATLPLADLTPAGAQALRAAVVEELLTLDPGDALEALLAAQIVTFSQAAMRAMRRSREVAEAGGAVERLEATAMALSRTARQQMKALEQRQKAARQPVRPAAEPRVAETRVAETRVAEPRTAEPRTAAAPRTEPAAPPVARPAARVRAEPARRPSVPPGPVPPVVAPPVVAPPVVAPAGMVPAGMAPAGGVPPVPFPASIPPAPQPEPAILAAAASPRSPASHKADLLASTARPLVRQAAE